jgi:nucleoside-diphosphate-sugar epimerase
MHSKPRKASRDEAPASRHSLLSATYLERRELLMIVVIGGTGFIGSRVVAQLGHDGHEAIAASPDTGVNTLTGHGLANALAEAAVVIDVSNPRGLPDADMMEFFETSTRNLLAAASLPFGTLSRFRW